MLRELATDPLGVASLASPLDLGCPPSRQRLSLPDLRNATAEAAFRRGSGFAFYQHLRKAGGTEFCDLAKRNLKRDEVPPYYCMPDHAGRLATPPQ